MFLFGIITLQISLLLTLIIDDYLWKTVVLGCSVGITGSITGLAVILINEILPEVPFKSKPSAYMFFGYGLGGLQIALVTYWVNTS